MLREWFDQQFLQTNKHNKGDVTMKKTNKKNYEFGKGQKKANIFGGGHAGTGEVMCFTNLVDYHADERQATIDLANKVKSGELAEEALYKAITQSVFTEFNKMNGFLRFSFEDKNDIHNMRIDEDLRNNCTKNQVKTTWFYCDTKLKQWYGHMVTHMNWGFEFFSAISKAWQSVLDDGDVDNMVKSYCDCEYAYAKYLISK